MVQNNDRQNKAATLEVVEGFLNAIANFYVSGYYLDLKDGKYIAIGQKREYYERYQAENDWSAMDDYIRECIHVDDQALITKVSRLDYIRERMKEESSFSVEVRDHGTGQERWYRYTTMRGADEDHVAITFADVTDEVNQRLELEKLTQKEKKLRVSSVKQNKQLKEKQEQLEESVSEQEAQLEEITALNTELENNQAELEASNAELEEERKKLSEAFGMIEGFSHEYHTIWVVDKTTLKMRLIRSTGVTTIQNAVQMGKDYPDFDSGFEKYINTYVEPVDRERMRKEIASAEILRQLQKSNFYSVNYLRRDDSGHVGYHQIAFANADTETGVKQFVYGFRDIDEIFREEQRQKEALEKANELLAKESQEKEIRIRIANALTKDYMNVFLVNAQTGISKALYMTEAIRVRIKVDVQEEHSYNEGISRFLGSGRVYSEDIASMSESTKLERVVKELQDKDEFVGNFRIVDEGTIHYFQFKYRTVKDTPYILFGFQNIDKQIEDELKKNEELQKSMDKQQAQLEEIMSLNSQLEDNQAELEASAAEQEAQLEEISKLNVALGEQSEELKRSLNVIGSLKNTVRHLYYIDMKDLSFVEIGQGGEKTAEIVGRKGYAKDSFEIMCRDIIVPQQAEELRTFTDLSTVDERLQGKEYLSVQFCDKDGHWSQGFLVPVSKDADGHCQELLWAVRNIDEFKLKEIEDNKALAEVDYIMANAGYGMWHIYLKDGVAPRMRANAKMTELLGATGKNLSEEEMYNAWYDQIVPEAIPSVQASVGEMMNGRFSENTYQWIHPTKGKIYVRCGGTAVKLEDGTNVLSGYHTDVTDIVFAEQKQKNELQIAYDLLAKNAAEKESQLIRITQLNNDIVKEQEAKDRESKIAEALVAIYLNVYLIHIPTKEVEIRKLNGYVTKGLSQDKVGPYPYDAICQKYIDNRVFEEDQPMVRANMALDNLLAQLSQKSDYEFNYRVLDNGSIHTYLGKYVRVDEETIVCGFRLIDDIIEEDKKKAQRLEAANAEIEKSRSYLANAYGMIEGFSQEYHTIWVVDKTTLKMRLIRSTGVTTIQNAVQMGKDYPDFDSGFKKYINTYVEPVDRERMLKEIASAEILRQLQKSNFYSVNYLRRDDSGHVGYHQIAFANADTETGVKQFVYGFRDVDAMVKEEQRKKEELLKAKESADAANKAKTRFLFNMSHDIRTPMNAIIGYSELLRKHEDDPAKINDYLDKIQSSSDFLLSLINNVLEMARIESGKTTLDESPCPSRKSYDEIKGVYSELMKNKKINFITEESFKTEYLYLDSIKLNEIVLNLVSNAYKYTPEGGTVSLKVEELDSDQEGYVLIRTTVADTGIGMSKEYLPTVFEEFSREQTSTENKIQGTGLGLPIVKKLVELMGGTIEVYSELGKGSTFIVTLPHRIAPKPEEHKENKESLDLTKFAGKRILLAEDNALNAEIASEILSEYGFLVEHAEDGIICVDMLTKAKAGYYDVILMDVQMPNLDGYGATKKIRALTDPAKANIPILAMTANAFDEDKQNALKAGMNGHLAKPIQITKLIEALNSVLDDKAALLSSLEKQESKKDTVNRVKRVFFEIKRNPAMSILPGGFFAYEAEKPERLIYANDVACHIWGCQNFEELRQHTGNSFKGFIHPDDYERVEKEIWKQINSGDTGLDQVKYRIVKKDGTVSHVDDYGRLVKDKENGNIFYVFVCESVKE